MINKKMTCFILLFYLFPISACLQMVEAKKESKELIKASFSERKLKYEKDVISIKSVLNERRKSRLITGFSPAASVFLYSIYTAKSGADFDNALKAKGELFIELYDQERIEGCSVLGIIAIAEFVSFAEKKQFIQKLLLKEYECRDDLKAKHAFKPTPKDEEFAFWTKFKEFAPEKYNSFDVDLIADALKDKKFLRKFNEQESLL